MEIAITYRSSEQIGPDDWRCFTKVLHLSEEQTLKEVWDKLIKTSGNKLIKNGDVEIHFNE